MLKMFDIHNIGHEWLLSLSGASVASNGFAAAKAEQECCKPEWTQRFRVRWRCKHVFENISDPKIFIFDKRGMLNFEMLEC